MIADGFARPIVVIAFLVSGVLGACAPLARHDEAAPRATEVFSPQRQPLATFSENGVTVEISLEKEASGHTWLVGTLMPEHAHFHLYSKDLPRAGIHGQGRPTRLEIVAPSEVNPIGELLANQPTEDHYVRALEQALPVYPEGPVIVRLPIELPAGTAALLTELSITYAACSDDTCLTPVIDKRVTVVIPNVIKR
jgi:hypothetical protein